MKGKIRGFPLCGRCYVQRDCKLVPMNTYKKSLPNDAVQYIGYASDEQDRLLQLDNKSRVSLLHKYSVTEQETFEICRSEGLLSPIYEFTNRGGCFFCPNAKKKELRHLYDHHPNLWSRMLALQGLPNKATERFNRRMKFSDIDALFRLEDAQCTLF